MKRNHFKTILFFWLFLLFVNCQDIKRPPLWTLFLFSQNPESVGVLTSDFGSAGRFKVLQPEANLVLPGEVPIHSDAVARFALGRVFVINRLNRDTIQILNPNLSFLPEREFSVGQGSNPQDIAVLNPNKAYIPLFNSGRVLIVQPSLGTTIGEIDLSRFSESVTSGSSLDGRPELASAFIWDNRLFVTAQRLDRNAPEGFFPPSQESSLLIEIETTTDTVVATYPFQSKNPIGFGQIVSFAGEPYVVFPVANRLGFLSQLDGGVEAFSLRSRTFLNRFLLSESTAGGDILAVQVQNESTGYASILTSSFEKRIVRFQPSTGTIEETLLSIPGNIGVNLSGLYLAPNGRLFIGNTDIRNPSVLVRDSAGTRSIGINLPPAQFVPLQEFPNP